MPPTAPYILNLHLYETLEFHVVIQTPYRVQCHLKTKEPLAVEKDLSMVYVFWELTLWGNHIAEEQGDYDVESTDIDMERTDNNSTLFEQYQYGLHSSQE